jgi:hypothetical protein
MEASLVQQRVGHRHEAEIERHLACDLFERRVGVDAHAVGLDIAGLLELLERLDPAVAQVLLARSELNRIGVVVGAEVVEALRRLCVPC